MSQSRAQYLLENYDDVITSLINQMDTYAHQSGGYMNRMHPDQFTQGGDRKEGTLSETRKRGKKSKTAKLIGRHSL